MFGNNNYLIIKIQLKLKKQTYKVDETIFVSFFGTRVSVCQEVDVVSMKEMTPKSYKKGNAANGFIRNSSAEIVSIIR